MSIFYTNHYHVKCLSIAYKSPFKKSKKKTKLVKYVRIQLILFKMQPTKRREHLSLV